MPDREHGISGLETDDDDKKLESLGYVPSFKREFSNLATVRELYPFFLLLLMDGRILHRLALPLASWCALPCFLCDHLHTHHLIGSCLVSRHHVQYPTAPGGAFVSTSTSTYRRSSMIPSTGVLLIGDLVLDSWSDHVFHIGWAVPLSAPPYPLSHVTGSSIAEIVSAFPTCGGLYVSLRHILS